MSFIIATDTSANLSSKLLNEKGVTVIPLSYIIDDCEYTCLDTEVFDGVKYYSEIKSGVKVSTSQITPQRYIEYLAPLLENGHDVLFIGMSSGVSDSYSSAEVAASQLRSMYSGRRLLTVDTLAASLGEGLFVLRAIELRKEGRTIEETAHELLRMRQCVYQVALIDDLMYLHRGGRVSGGKAIVGTVLGIKPILKGSPIGELIPSGKVRGRKKGLAELARRYGELVHEPEKQVVGIAYTDCREDAEKLAEMLRSVAAPKEIMLACYEPVTGSHIGPGTVALFFVGKHGVREYY